MEDGILWNVCQNTNKVKAGFGNEYVVDLSCCNVSLMNPDSRVQNTLVKAKDIKE